MLINLLSSYFYGNFFDVMLEKSRLRSVFNVPISFLRSYLLVRNSYVHSTYKISVSADGAADFFVVSWGSVKGLLNTFHREVGVTSVNDLKVGDLRITGEINILSAIGNELHKSSSHDILYIDTNNLEKKTWNI